MNYEVYLYQDGIKEEVALKKSKNIGQTIASYLHQAQEPIRLLLSQEDLEEIYSKEKAWAIEYSPSQKIEIGPYGSHMIKQIVVPITGEISIGLDRKQIFIITVSEENTFAIWSCPNQSATNLEP